MVYTTDTSIDPSTALIYTAGWEENTEEGTAQLISQAYGYLPINDYSPNLWIAIRYSEPMNTEPGDVWITGENKGIDSWSSDRSGIFRPEPVISNWPEEFEQLETGRLADGVWHLYKYKGSLSSEYKGRLTIHISASDYGGNSVDSDPSTIATPRDADGSWNGQQLFDEEPDASYTWGDCCWQVVVDYETETGYFKAMVGYTEVQRVTFPELGFSFPGQQVNLFSVLGEIPYNNGCYACWLAGGYTPEHVFISGRRTIRIIDGDGGVSGLLEGPASAGDTYYEMDTWFTSSNDRGIDWENNHLWFRERNAYGYIHDLRSDEIWYVINGHNGASYTVSAHTILGEDHSEAWFDSTQFYFINCNYPEPVFIGTGWSIPIFYVEKYNPVPYYMDDIYVSAPGNDQSVDMRLQENESVALPTPQYEFSLRSIFPNPVESSVTVSYSLADTGVYMLAIYDLSGRRVAELCAGNLLTGNHSVDWDLVDDSGIRVPSGVYYVRLHGCGKTEAKSMVVLQ